MNIQELEQAVAQLSAEDLQEFAQWFTDYHHEAWDKQIVEDSKAGRLDKLIQKAHEDFKARDSWQL